MDQSEAIPASFQVMEIGPSVLCGPEMKAMGLILNMATRQVTFNTGKIAPITVEPCSVHSMFPLEHTIAVTEVQCPDSEVQALQDRFPKLFSPGIGLYTGPEHKICLKPDTIPHRSRMREAPFAFIEMAREEIESMLKDGLVEHVNRSEWVALVHYVKKPGNLVRVTVDFSTCLNKAIQLVIQLLPHPTDIFQSVRKAKYLSKLDIAKGYWHIPLHKQSKPITAFLTPSHGLLQFTRLLMGMIDSGAVFCKAIEETLQGLNGVESYVDDILIYRWMWKEHDKNLHSACRRLQNAGFKINLSKISICKQPLSMLWSILMVTPGGIKISIDPKKTEAIAKTPIPTTVTHVRYFLGACERTHIPWFAMDSEPLTNLTWKNVPFIWSEDCQLAFDALKSSMIHTAYLMLFDLELPVLLCTDASDYSLRACLFMIKDGEPLPVSFTAQMLCPAERNYSTSEKEALAGVWVIDKQFSKYLHGIHFTIESNQSSLMTLLIQHSARASQRIQILFHYLACPQKRKLHHRFPFSNPFQFWIIDEWILIYAWWQWLQRDHLFLGWNSSFGFHFCFSSGWWFDTDPIFHQRWISQEGPDQTLSLAILRTAIQAVYGRWTRLFRQLSVCSSCTSATDTVITPHRIFRDCPYAATVSTPLFLALRIYGSQRFLRRVCCLSSFRFCQTGRACSSKSNSASFCSLDQIESRHHWNICCHASFKAIHRGTAELLFKVPHLFLTDSISS
ncbi:MAG: hypothetical protein GY679_04100, partial [Mycoplasma sp.]|nr:hypothetical protein [Mycoplasma sp.]